VNSASDKVAGVRFGEDGVAESSPSSCNRMNLHDELLEDNDDYKD